MYDRRLATRISAGVDARFRLLALLRGQRLSQLLDQLLDRGMPSADELADQLAAWQAGAAAAEQMVAHAARAGLSPDRIADNHSQIQGALVGHQARTPAEADWLAGWTETTAARVESLRGLDRQAKESHDGR